MAHAKVIISPNPTKTSDRMDLNGNIINPRTKQIIVPKEKEYIPPPPPITPPTSTAPVAPPPEPIYTPVTTPTVKDDPLSIQTEIDQTKARLVELNEAKKLKIKETEKLLKELKKQ